MPRGIRWIQALNGALWALPWSGRPGLGVSRGAPRTRTTAGRHAKRRRRRPQWMLAALPVGLGGRSAPSWRAAAGLGRCSRRRHHSMWRASIQRATLGATQGHRTSSLLAACARRQPKSTTMGSALPGLVVVPECPPRSSMDNASACSGEPLPALACCTGRASPADLPEQSRRGTVEYSVAFCVVYGYTTT